MSDKQILVYDCDLQAPACVMIQAVMGCGASPLALQYFDPRHWLITPTPGMRKMAGTPEEWAMVAEITMKKWGKKRPQAK